MMASYRRNTWRRWLRTDSHRPALAAKTSGVSGFAEIYDFSIDRSELGFNGNPALQETKVLQSSRLHVGPKARKHLVEVLVIDQVERTPKEN